MSETKIKPQFNWLTFWKRFITIFVFVFSIFYFPLFGLTFPPCPSRERIRNFDEGMTFRFKYPMVYQADLNGNGCVNDNWKQTLVAEPGKNNPNAYPESFSSFSHTPNYFPSDEVFRVVNVIDRRHFGLAGISEGNGWNTYIIFADTKNNLYHIQCYLLVDNTDTNITPLNCTNIYGL